MKLHPFLPRLALVALLAPPFTSVRATDQTPPKADRYEISIDFEGGPLSKLVAMFAANKEGPLSIIQAEGLDPVLPAFSVHNVRVDQVITALGQIVEPQGYRLSPTGPGLAVLSKFERHTSQDFASFQLARKLGDGKVEEIIAAIQTGCEFANPGGKASTLRFKYHPGTKLLFVAGTEQEVGIARRVFDSLPDQPATEPPPSNQK